MKIKDIVVGQEYAAGLGEYTSKRRVLVLATTPFESERGKIGRSPNWRGVGYGNNVGMPCIAIPHGEEKFDREAVMAKWAAFEATVPLGNFYRGAVSIPDDMPVYVYRPQEIISTWAEFEAREKAEMERVKALRNQRERAERERAEWVREHSPLAEALRGMGFMVGTLDGATKRISMNVTPKQAEAILSCIGTHRTEDSQ